MGDARIHKQCLGCKRELPLSQFQKTKKNKSGVMARCAKCYKHQVAAMNSRARNSLRVGGGYADMLAKKSEARKKSKADRRDKVNARLKRGETFCGVMRSCRWSSAYVKSKQNSKMSLGIEDVSLGKITLCQVIGIKKWPDRGSAKWQEIARPSELADFLAEFPWREAGLSSTDRYKIRYNADVAFNAKERLRCRLKKKTNNEVIGKLIRSAASRGGSSPTIQKILGYSVADFVVHFGRCFGSGMTWDHFVRGEIHIDHIRPCSSFDLTDPQQVIDCWALSNLQPLWARDNLRKGASLRVFI